MASPDNHPLFRKAALDKLASPEQLDQLMRVTSPRAWLALVGLAAVAVAVIVWAIVGTIPTRIVGQGILIRTGGVSQIVSLSGGRVLDLAVTAGDVIRPGMLLGRVVQGELADRLDQARTELSLARGGQGAAGGAAEAARVAELETRLAAIQQEVTVRSTVLADREGRVVEVTAAPGQVIAPGSGLLSVEPLSGALEALLYLSPTEGKNVQVGMPVRISPSTVKREEYGYIVGRVRSVSSFPATRLGMMRVLGNEALVTSLSANGAPFEVYADLDLAADTPSGYRWSSGTGPDVGLFSGTLCAGLITVRVQRPISLVIPYVRGAVGL
ncbi:MAG: NHLP bacteriocin system secretion protein [Vicinamibacterales bacterium]